MGKWKWVSRLAKEESALWAKGAFLKGKFPHFFQFYFSHSSCVSCTDRLESAIFLVFFWELPVYNFCLFSLLIYGNFLYMMDIHSLWIIYFASIFFYCHLSFNLVHSKFYILMVLNISPVKSVNTLLYGFRFVCEGFPYPKTYSKISQIFSSWRFFYITTYS